MKRFHPADRLILPFLMVMLFAAFAAISLTRLRTAFRNRRVVGSSLLVNFIWNPLLAVLLGAIFLRNHPALWVGLIMLMVTPCTDWYLIFTDIADGDVPLATSLLPYNLVLQLILLPAYLYVIAGTFVHITLELLIEVSFSCWQSRSYSGESPGGDSQKLRGQCGSTRHSCHD